MAIHDNHVMEEPSIRLWQRAYYFLLLLQQISLPLYHRHVRRNVEPKVRQETVSFAPKQFYPSPQLSKKGNVQHKHSRKDNVESQKRLGLVVRSDVDIYNTHSKMSVLFHSYTLHNKFIHFALVQSVPVPTK